MQSSRCHLPWKQCANYSWFFLCNHIFISIVCCRFFKLEKSWKFALFSVCFGLNKYTQTKYAQTHTHTYTSGVHKQTKTHKNASGTCHNRASLLEWCLINRRLVATGCRYLSHFYSALVTLLLLWTRKCFPPCSVAHLKFLLQYNQIHNVLLFHYSFLSNMYIVGMHLNVW